MDSISEPQVAGAEGSKSDAVRTHDLGIKGLGGGDEPGVIFAAGGLLIAGVAFAAPVFKAD